MRKLQQRPHSDLSDWILIGAIALMNRCGGLGTGACREVVIAVG